MIAAIRASSTTARNDFSQDRFLELLPRIKRQAVAAFRGLRAEAREDLVVEVIARAYCLFVRLVRRGKQDLAYATPLAQFAIRQVRAGRRVGCCLNKDDTLSPYCRRIRGLKIEQLDQSSPRTGNWRQLLVEDRSAGPAETAAARIDLAAWHRTLPRRNRRIARALARGEQTASVARRFSLSPGRISQLRNCLRADWNRFQGCEQPVG